MRLSCCVAAVVSLWLSACSPAPKPAESQPADEPATTTQPDTQSTEKPLTPVQQWYAKEFATPYDNSIRWLFAQLLTRWDYRLDCNPIEDPVRELHVGTSGRYGIVRTADRCGTFAWTLMRSSQAYDGKPFSRFAYECHSLPYSRQIGEMVQQEWTQSITTGTFFAEGIRLGSTILYDAVIQLREDLADPAAPLPEPTREITRRWEIPNIQYLITLERSEGPYTFKAHIRTNAGEGADSPWCEAYVDFTYKPQPATSDT